jgi:predicted dehydrogenase
MGRVHTEALWRLGNVEVVAVGGRDAAAYDKVLRDPSVKAVHVCTPNSSHYKIADHALLEGKHVLCEKPLAVSVREARSLMKLAQLKKLRNCTCHNLRYYPMVQQMRRMREAGDLGEILVAQGTYSQDWLLYDTDWNWRIDPRESGPSRAMADIGSHWCDMAEHVTGLRITSLCADLQTFHKTRKRPRGDIETFAGKTAAPQEYDVTAIETEDFGAVLFRMGERTRGAFTASQVSAGRKNRLSIEVFGSRSSVAWDQERPDELWIGNRNANNQVIIKDPSLMKEAARSYADLPGGHSEGYDDTFKQVFRRFYRSIEDANTEAEYPQFADGLRQLVIVEAELASSRAHAWVDVPS